MSVRDAVETRGQAVEAAAEKPSINQVVAEAIEAQLPTFRSVLPSDVDADRFKRLAMSAVRQTPALMRCFESAEGRTSVMLACFGAATVGLEPNTPTQDAWLLPRKVKGKTEARLSISYRGLLKLARRSGNIRDIRAEVVRDGDHFEWWFGLDADHLAHKPVPRDRQGEFTHVYAIVRYLHGGVDFVVLEREDVEHRRASSDSWKAESQKPVGDRYGPWSKYEASMWRKSAVRALWPFLELSPEAHRAYAMDDRPLRLDDYGDIAPMSAPELPEVPEGDGEVIDADDEVSSGPISVRADDAAAGEDGPDPVAGRPDPEPAAEPAPAPDPPSDVTLEQLQELKRQAGVKWDTAFDELERITGRRPSGPRDAVKDPMMARQLKALFEDLIAEDAITVAADAEADQLALDG